MVKLLNVYQMYELLDHFLYPSEWVYVNMQTIYGGGLNSLQNFWRKVNFIFNYLFILRDYIYLWPGGETKSEGFFVWLLWGCF